VILRDIPRTPNKAAYSVVAVAVLWSLVCVIWYTRFGVERDLETPSVLFADAPQKNVERAFQVDVGVTVVNAVNQQNAPSRSQLNCAPQVDATELSNQTPEQTSHSSPLDDEAVANRAHFQTDASLSWLQKLDIEDVRGLLASNTGPMHELAENLDDESFTALMVRGFVRAHVLYFTSDNGGHLSYTDNGLIPPEHVNDYHAWKSICEAYTDWRPTSEGELGERLPAVAMEEWLRKECFARLRRDASLEFVVKFNWRDGVIERFYRYETGSLPLYEAASQNESGKVVRLDRVYWYNAEKQELYSRWDASES